jgi:hypothetical protein
MLISFGDIPTSTPQMILYHLSEHPLASKVDTKLTITKCMAENRVIGWTVVS